jgi:hypothetical protein
MAVGPSKVVARVERHVLEPGDAAERIETAS